jgi:hypothetical protein
MKNIKKYKQQQGISLPVVLFVLIGMLLGSLLLIRSGYTSIMVSNNIGSKAQLLGSNDQALSYALKWLQSNQQVLNNDNLSIGYLSSIPSQNIDYTLDENWNSSKVLPKDNMGNTNSIIIVRMCNIPNAAMNQVVNGVNNKCATEANSSAIATNNSSYGYGAFQFTQQPSNTPIMYKVIVKTVGPRNASIITQSVISL